MKLVDAVKQFPKICGNKNYERWAAVIEWQFEYEKNNKDSVFAVKNYDIDKPKNRFETIFAWPVSFFNRGIKEYCKNLVLLCALSHYVNEHHEVAYLKQRNALSKKLRKQENLYPEVSEIYSVAEADRGFWF